MPTWQTAKDLWHAFQIRCRMSDNSSQLPCFNCAVPHRQLCWWHCCSLPQKPSISLMTSCSSVRVSNHRPQWQTQKPYLRIMSRLLISLSDLHHHCGMQATLCTMGPQPASCRSSTAWAFESLRGRVSQVSTSPVPGAASFAGSTQCSRGHISPTMLLLLERGSCDSGIRISSLLQTFCRR